MGYPEYVNYETEDHTYLEQIYQAIGRRVLQKWDTNAELKTFANVDKEYSKSFTGALTDYYTLELDQEVAWTPTTAIKAMFKYTYNMSVYITIVLLDVNDQVLYTQPEQSINAYNAYALQTLTVNTTQAGVKKIKIQERQSLGNSNTLSLNDLYLDNAGAITLLNIFAFKTGGAAEIHLDPRYIAGVFYSPVLTPTDLGEWDMHLHALDLKDGTLVIDLLDGVSGNVLIADVKNADMLKNYTVGIRSIKYKFSAARPTTADDSPILYNVGIMYLG